MVLVSLVDLAGAFWLPLDQPLGRNTCCSPGKVSKRGADYNCRFCSGEDEEEKKEPRRNLLRVSRFRASSDTAERVHSASEGAVCTVAFAVSMSACEVCVLERCARFMTVLCVPSRDSRLGLHSVTLPESLGFQHLWSPPKERCWWHC